MAFGDASTTVLPVRAKDYEVSCQLGTHYETLPGSPSYTLLLSMFLLLLLLRRHPPLLVSTKNTSRTHTLKIRPPLATGHPHRKNIQYIYKKRRYPRGLVAVVVRSLAWRRRRQARTHAPPLALSVRLLDGD